MKEKVLSVGIDMGTSTTEVIFSYIVVENMAAGFRVPNIQIVDKQVIYRSQVHITPLLSNTVLDIDQIIEIIQKEYEKAGFLPGEVKTGAVIITGDTARKENAQLVLKKISDFAGDFVVATAGPELESVLAGKGSGAEAFSKKNKGKIINLDIGGGTTNTAIFENGEVIQTGCFDIGGRLFRYDEETKKVTYLYHKIQKLLSMAGCEVSVGDILRDEDIEIIAEILAQGIVEIIFPNEKSALSSFLSTNLLSYHMEKPDYVSFSGGVGDLIYKEEMPNRYVFGDIGVILAEKIRNRITQKEKQFELIHPKETIGATVVGAGTHSMNISGSTITVTAKSHLPLINLPLLKMGNILKMSDDEIRREFNKRIKWLQGDDFTLNIAFALETDEILSFQQIQLLAEKIVLGIERYMETQSLLVVILKEDMGKVLGQSIKKLLPKEKEIICLDDINVGSGDYIDIGRPVGVGDALPIVIKTIAFVY